jgi:hypothetical protein
VVLPKLHRANGHHTVLPTDLVQSKQNRRPHSAIWLNGKLRTDAETNMLIIFRELLSSM